MQKIADELGQEIGIKMIPHIADCYPQILTALTQKKPVLAYMGSMVSAIIWSRALGKPLFQAMDQKHFYGGILLFPKGLSPEAILQDHPAEIAYTVGATSGEVCAKVATGGRASIKVSDHRAAADAVQSGEAKAAFVKNFWWEANKNSYPELDSYSIPGLSDFKNADNVLLASNYVTPELKSLLLSSAIGAPQIFDADLVVPFDSSSFAFTLGLMKKAGIDPLTYTWPISDAGPCVLVEEKREQASQTPLVSAGQTPEETTAAVDGEMVLQKHCGECHLVEKVKKYRRKTPKEWERVLTWKMKMGVELTEAERTALLKYLISLKKK